MCSRLEQDHLCVAFIAIVCFDGSQVDEGDEGDEVGSHHESDEVDEGDEVGNRQSTYDLK